ncbi:penicillin-binding protein activator [Dyella sp.]|jgi:outer membrane PBP1 activator LpoA protein|uniref:penicillin-binding protein activator n=1 Tax=Dyella sp. TaxID=1869338 RepID=UPI002D775388|nr:penicillin-binding protein activator [Dyella sp.]HET6433387.1 penicillin-binding protein activator [Dyella sp.]
MRMYRAAGLAVLISLALAACVPQAAQRSPAEVAAMRSADALRQQGQFEQAAQAYLALAANSPGHADSYRLNAAEAYRQEGALTRAAEVLTPVRRERLSGDEPVRLDLLRAEIALDQHDPRSALALTTQPNLHVPPALQLRVLELRARAMDASGDHWGSARTRVQMDDALSGLDRSQNQRQILDLLGRLSVAELQQRAAAMTSADRMLPWINEALSQQGITVANPQPELKQPVGTMLPGAHANVREGYRMPSQIALLLPANRELASVATSIREGFFAAYADASRTHAPRAALRVYDSTGTAAGAVKAYQQAVRDGAQLVVGPLTRAEVAAVIAQDNLPAPVLALNHPDGRSAPSAAVMEFGLLPETEGAQVADHLVERGLHTAYVVTSSDDFAQRAADAFRAELIARGGQVAGRASIASGSINYAATISTLNARADDPDAAIFISMRPEQARLLVPQLRIAGLTLPILATSHVYGGIDDAGADRDLDGVEFCDAPWLFDAQPGLPSHAGIATALPEASGSAGRLFAFGMDAWNLAPYLDWLRDHPGSYLPGATGQLAADQFGRVRRVLVWARFTDGLARPLSGSLQFDDTPSSAPPQSVPDDSVPAPASSVAGDDGR